MDKDEVAKILKPAFPGDLIEVDGENSYFTVSIVSDKFENLTKLKRQQFVYSCLTEQISSSSLILQSSSASLLSLPLLLPSVFLLV